MKNRLPQTKARLSVTVDKELLGLIDKERGMTKRSSVVNKILREALMPRNN